VGLAGDYTAITSLLTGLGTLGDSIATLPLDRVVERVPDERRSSFRFLEPESDFQSKFNGACYSGYLGNSWGGKKEDCCKSDRTRLVINLAPQTDI